MSDTKPQPHYSDEVKKAIYEYWLSTGCTMKELGEKFELKTSTVNAIIDREIIKKIKK